MSLRLLHSADWQIGKAFGQFEADESTLLAQARLDVVSTLAALACTDDCHAILVAGDVFDAQGIADKTVHRLFQAMQAYPGPWILIPGNHDAGLSESIWHRAHRLGAVPDNVHVCLDGTPVRLAAHRASILPAPLTQRHTYEDLTAAWSGIDTPQGDYRIGLAHGCVQGILAEDIDSANPIAAERAEQARLDYLALGDWHGTRQIDARTWYSGTPETDRFRANDSGQALRVDLDAPGRPPVVRAVRTGRYHWVNRQETLSVPSDVDAAIDGLASLSAAHVVQWQARGTLDLPGRQRLLAALSRARGTVRAWRDDLTELRLAPTADDIAALQVDGYLTPVLQALLTEQEAADPQTAQTARDALQLLAGLLQDEAAPAAAREASTA